MESAIVHPLCQTETWIIAYAKITLSSISNEAISAGHINLIRIKKKHTGAKSSIERYRASFNYFNIVWKSLAK